jgi:hypothetical protein
MQKLDKESLFINNKRNREPLQNIELENGSNKKKKVKEYFLVKNESQITVPIKKKKSTFYTYRLVECSTNRIILQKENRIKKLEKVNK